MRGCPGNDKCLRENACPRDDDDDEQDDDDDDAKRRANVRVVVLAPHGWKGENNRVRHMAMIII